MRLFVFIAIFIMFGCASVQPITPSAVTIDNLKVHIVPDCGDAYGYVTGDNGRYEIFVEGTPSGGQIEIDDYVLGHELRHILNWKNGKIVNPDERGY